MDAVDRGDSLHLRVFTARDSVITTSWDEVGVCSTYWRYYVNSRSGAAVRMSDGSLHLLKPRQVHFIPAWVRFDLLNVRPVGHLYMHFDIVGLPGTLVREMFTRPVALPLAGAVRATADDLHAILASDDPASRPAALFAVKAALHAAVAALFSRLPSAHAQRIAAVLHADSPVAPALRHIEANLTAPLRLSGLARLCGYAEDHFARLFLRDVGQTPGQYLIERRIAIAAQRLVLSDDSIDDIAVACGFSDRFYFSRVFARRMGVPPAAYRRAEPIPHGDPTRLARPRRGKL